MNSILTLNQITHHSENLNLDYRINSALNEADPLPNVARLTSEARRHPFS